MAKPLDPTNSVEHDKVNGIWKYKIVAFEMPIFFNDFGDHNHDGMMYTLKRHHRGLVVHGKLVKNALKAIKRVHEREQITVERLNPETQQKEKVRVPDPYWVVDIKAAKDIELEELFQRLSKYKDEDVRALMQPIMALSVQDRKGLLHTHPLVRPLVLRARVGETIEIELENHIIDREEEEEVEDEPVDPEERVVHRRKPNQQKRLVRKARWVGFHLNAGGYDFKSDGSKVGGQDSLVPPGGKRHYEWKCEHEGVFVFHDMGDPDGDEDGTNAHGLFGALVVEPANAWWTDPEEDTKQNMAGARENAHGMLAVDVHLRPQAELEALPDTKKDKCPNGRNPETRSPKYPLEQRSFREFVIFIHDEPESHEPHWLENVPSAAEHVAHWFDHESGKKPKETAVEKQGHDAKMGGSLMCINYRSEQMEYRRRLIQKWTNQGLLERAVLDEDQHHSSWMFGDPATPVLKAYTGDPVRIHLVHAGVKETHVFHLHVYEWHADPHNTNSPLIDAISISPGCGHTIVPLFGAGNVQAVPGDVIWHCHLYPHFHMGMWGMLRTFDTLQTGFGGLHLKSNDPRYADRQIGVYPDDAPIAHLEPLPDRQVPPKPTPEKPGFPLFIAGKQHQKSPIPPWPSKTKHDYQRPPNEDQYDYREPTDLETEAMQPNARPGELFISFAHPTQKATWEKDESGQRKVLVKHPEFSTRAHTIAVTNTMIVYNNDGWHDPDGHLFYMPDEKTIKITDASDHPGHQHADTDHGDAAVLTGATNKARLQQQLADPANVHEPLFFRCQHGEVLELTFENRLRPLNTSRFDMGLPPTDPHNGHRVVQGLFGKNEFLGECGLHVHLVKFDPICADGASTGWNYVSAPSMGKKMIYRWWADEEFGTIFFHDHLFANTRQRHGLFGALLVEPKGAKFLDPWTHEEIVAGVQAVIALPDGQQFREFCVGVGDWIATYDKNGKALQPPDHLGSHDDNGLMVVNYRSAPLKERRIGNEDVPHLWFSSRRSIGGKGDPDTTVFETHAGDPVWIRLIQGSHEEQHSFQIHGLRWHRFRNDGLSPTRNQQTLGISEAFTFKLDGPILPGDYLWKFAGIDDTWLGCWGLIRSHESPDQGSSKKPSKLQIRPLAKDNQARILEARQEQREVVSSAVGSDKSPNQNSRPSSRPSSHLGDVSLNPNVLTDETKPTRKYHIVAKHRKIQYRDDHHPEGSLIDPFGLYFHAVSMTPPDSDQAIEFDHAEGQEPLIIRARKGERLEITLENLLPPQLTSEPLVLAPALDLERNDIDAKRKKPSLPKSMPEDLNAYLYENKNDDEDEVNYTQVRDISNHISLHADMVFYDVRTSDGATVGRNEIQTAPPMPQNPEQLQKVGPDFNKITYVWYADQEGPCLLQDMADLRNHRHHGLVGALIIEPEGSTPLKVQSGKATASAKANEAWVGSRATVVNGDKRDEEVVLILQDGLRLFRDDKVPVGKKPFRLDPGDIPGDGGFDSLPDNEDQGQKAFNYRTALLDEAMKPSKEWPTIRLERAKTRLEKLLKAKRMTKEQFEAKLEELKTTMRAEKDDWLFKRGHDWFVENPPTPTFTVPRSKKDDPVRVSFHLICAADRPRNHSFTIHGHSWREYPHDVCRAECRNDVPSPQVSAEPAISSGTIRTFLFTANTEPGDYLYRSGITKWTIAQGLWGVLRVD